MSFIHMLTTLSLGALHALEPGHGKAFLASYAVGNEITKKKSFQIIISMAISHSVLLMVLAIVVPLFFPTIEESIHVFIMIAAALIILYVGIKMLYQCITKKHSPSNCNCGIDHSNEIPSNIINVKKSNTILTGKIDSSKLSFIKPTAATQFTPTKAIPTAKKSFWKKITTNINFKDNSIMVGVVNGIMPCPSALAVVGLAFTQSSVLHISLTMIAYVIGFISAMVCLLILVVYFKSKVINKRTNTHTFENKIHILSSCMIILSGCYYLFIALNHSH